nr:carotenoid biosynthesis protein [Parafrankia elaeagni]
MPAVPTPSPVLDALAPLALLGFVVAHASLAVGWQGLAVYVATSYVVALAFEATSIAVGFPFGYYIHHTEGPRLFDVPVVVPLGYVVYGWIAWTLAGLITRAGPQAGSRAHRVVTPVVAPFVLAGWDFGYDAIGSTVRDLYTYRDPSGFMGVPLGAERIPVAATTNGATNSSPAAVSTSHEASSSSNVIATALVSNRMPRRRSSRSATKFR